VAKGRLEAAIDLMVFSHDLIWGGRRPESGHCELENSSFVSSSTTLLGEALMPRHSSIPSSAACKPVPKAAWILARLNGLRETRLT
jgi:hypothetical protein